MTPETWDDLARKQRKHTREELAQLEAGTVLALQDRNSYAHPTWRPVFVRIGQRSITLLDTRGRLIDEPGDGLPDGVQPRDEFNEEYEASGEEYYRHPLLRRLPQERTPPASSNDVVADGRRATHQRLARCDSRERENLEARLLEDVVEPDREGARPLMEDGRKHSTMPLAPQEDCAMLLDTAYGDASSSEGEEGKCERGGGDEAGRETCDEMMRGSGGDSTVGENMLLDEVYGEGSTSDGDDEMNKGGGDETGVDDMRGVGGDTIGGENMQGVGEVGQEDNEGEDETSAHLLKGGENMPGFGKEGNAGEDETSAHLLSVRQRVHLAFDTHEGIVYEGGMVTQTRSGEVLFALDSGQWLSLPVAEAICRSNCVPATSAGIVHGKLTGSRKVSGFTQEGSRVTGMLLGHESERVFAGQGCAYFAHEARPRAAEANLRRQAHGRFMESSFAMGDVVQAVQDERLRAAVVRVVYNPKEGRRQARKLLLLFELAPSGGCANVERKPQFFPASWGHWQRVSAEANGWEDADKEDPTVRGMVLTPEQCSQLEQVSSYHIMSNCYYRTMIIASVNCVECCAVVSGPASKALRDEYAGDRVENSRTPARCCGPNKHV